MTWLCIVSDIMLLMIRDEVCHSIVLMQYVRLLSYWWWCYDVGLFVCSARLSIGFLKCNLCGCSLVVTIPIRVWGFIYWSRHAQKLNRFAGERKLKYCNPLFNILSRGYGSLLTNRHASQVDSNLKFCVISSFRTDLLCKFI